MSWVQVKSPNLNVQTSMGMCLKYVQDAFGSGWAGSYALQGWRDIVKKKHTNRNIPGGIYVPIWFEGYWNGVNYGHVAIYKDGVCWSSPYTNKTTHDRLGSIAEVERIYGMKYIGWSEDIGGTTVIKENVMAQSNLATARQLDYAILGRDGRGGRPNAYAGQMDDEIKRTGRDRTELTVQFINTLFDSKEAQGYRKNIDAIYSANARLNTEVARLKAENDTYKANADKATKESAKANAAKAEAEERLKQLAAEQSQAKREADNFLTALINSVRKWFGGER